MNLVEGQPFSDVRFFDDHLLQLKLAGMKRLGVPESLASRTKMDTRAVELYLLENGQRRKMMAGRIGEMRRLVASVPGEFVLAVRI